MVTARIKSAKPPQTHIYRMSKMAKHEHGSMDISAQEKAYDGFLKASTRVGIASIVVLILLAVYNS